MRLASLMAVGLGAIASRAALANSSASAIGERWSMSLELRHGTYIGMERHIATAIDGVAWFELAPDGTARGCVARHQNRHGTESHFVSYDHEDHDNHDDDRDLLALKGRWSRSDGQLDLAFTAASWNGCMLAAATFDPHERLRCTVAAAAQNFPWGTLVCENGKDDPFELGIHLDAKPEDWSPGSSPSGLSFILGPAAGVHVRVAQGSGDRIPAIEVRVGAGSLREADFKAGSAHIVDGVAPSRWQ